MFISFDTMGCMVFESNGISQRGWDCCSKGFFFGIHLAAVHTSKIHICVWNLMTSREQLGGCDSLINQEMACQRYDYTLCVIVSEPWWLVSFIQVNILSHDTDYNQVSLLCFWRAYLSWFLTSLWSFCHSFNLRGCKAKVAYLSFLSF